MKTQKIVCTFPPRRVVVVIVAPGALWTYFTGRPLALLASYQRFLTQLRAQGQNVRGN